MRLNPCRWCGKYNRNASDWEQYNAYRDQGWTPLCVRCANSRLNNPFSTVKMRRVGEVSTP